jgi:activator of HSP90 ATPase
VAIYVVQFFHLDIGNKRGLCSEPFSAQRESERLPHRAVGHITGRHIELVPDQRIVQARRVVDWILGVYSIVKFELTEQGSDTKIIFDHTGFPVGKAQHLAEGWKANYWELYRNT